MILPFMTWPLQSHRITTGMFKGHPDSEGEKLDAKTYQGNGKVLEGQVGWEIQLCPSLENMICTMELWRQEEVRGKTSACDTYHLLKVSFNFLQRTLFKGFFNFFPFIHESTYLDKVIPYLLYARPPERFTNVTSDSPAHLHFIVTSISHRKKQKENNLPPMRRWQNQNSIPGFSPPPLGGPA